MSSTNFGQIKTNIGNRVGDTSSTFATQLGIYINQRYKDVLRRTNWEVIKEDYEVSVSASTQDYTLPTNFGKELYAFDQTNNKDLARLPLERLEQEYQDTLNNAGTVDYYTIFDTTDSTAASASRIKKLRVWKMPSSAIVIELPYTIYPADLSASTDELVLECERAVEYGATCDAWLTKRQAAKATAFEALYEKEIQSLIWDKHNKLNELTMMNVCPLDRNLGID